MKGSILFVDDDTAALNRLKKMMHSQRREWCMAFVESVNDALDLLDKEQFDIVVADINMPGMDGLKLLERVREQHPNAARFVLSGQSGQRVILESAGIVHQFIANPYEARQIKTAISRTINLQYLLKDESLKAVISKMKTLPSVPAIYRELLEELKAENPSLKKVATIISKDIGMTAKILQLINSAFFGIHKQISDTFQAIHFLGLETIEALVLSIQIFSQFDLTKISAVFLQNHWYQSMKTALIAKAIAKTEKLQKPIVDYAFMAGLLHDVGQLVLADNFPEEFNKVLKISEDKDHAFWEIERDLFGITHAEIGAYLMGLWGLPFSVIEAIAYHHNPGVCEDKLFNALSAVHVADFLVHALSAGKDEEFAAYIDADYLVTLNLTVRMSEWRILGQDIMN